MAECGRVPVASIVPDLRLVHIGTTEGPLLCTAMPAFVSDPIFPSSFDVHIKHAVFIVSEHRLSSRPPPPPPALPLVHTQAPTPLKSPPSPHRLYYFQDILDKLMHFLPQLSDFVPLRNVFFFVVSAHRLTKVTLLTLISYTVVARGVADLYP